MFPSSLTVIANEPNAMCIAETSAPHQPKPAVEDCQSTCTSGPCIGSADRSDTFHDYTLPSFQLLAYDPFTTCLAESKAINGHTNPPLLSARYKPAYMLQDESLERAGRVSSNALLGSV